MASLGCATRPAGSACLSAAHRAEHISAITRAGSDILIIDYRGFGKSAGTPSEQGIYFDGQAAFDWLASRKGEAPIVCYGESLGTAVATEIALRRRCAGVILEGAFPSRAELAAQVIPVVGPLVARGFETGRCERITIRALQDIRYGQLPPPGTGLSFHVQ